MNVKPVKGRAQRIVDPLTAFLRTEAGGGAALIAAAVVALILANSPLSAGYEALWTTDIAVGFGEVAIAQDLRHWVNDCLMAIFFFVISLEVKRELVTGGCVSRGRRRSRWSRLSVARWYRLSCSLSWRAPARSVAGDTHGHRRGLRHRCTRAAR